MEKVHNKPFFACTGASRNESSLRGGVVGGGVGGRQLCVYKRVGGNIQKIHTWENKSKTSIQKKYIPEKRKYPHAFKVGHVRNVLTA